MDVLAVHRPHATRQITVGPKAFDNFQKEFIKLECLGYGADTAVRRAAIKAGFPISDDECGAIEVVVDYQLAT